MYITSSPSSKQDEKITSEEDIIQHQENLAELLGSLLTYYQFIQFCMPFLSEEQAIALHNESEKQANESEKKAIKLHNEIEKVLNTSISFPNSKKVSSTLQSVKCFLDDICNLFGNKREMEVLTKEYFDRSVEKQRLQNALYEHSFYRKKSSTPASTAQVTRTRSITFAETVSQKVLGSTLKDFLKQQADQLTEYQEKLKRCEENQEKIRRDYKEKSEENTVHAFAICRILFSITQDLAIVDSNRWVEFFNSSHLTNLQKPVSAGLSKRFTM